MIQQLRVRWQFTDMPEVIHGGHQPGHGGKPYKKRKSWLEDIFD